MTQFQQYNFVKSISEMSSFAHAEAIKKGFWDSDRNNGELIALIHSELSEALEGLRHNNPPSDKIPEFTSVEEELADACIRIFDMADARGYRLGEAIIAKLRHNRERLHKHGKEF